MVVGLVSTEERARPVEGIFFSSGKAVVRAIDPRTGQVVASVALENEKEGGSSFQVAGMRLLQKMGKKIGRDLGDSINAVYNHEGQSGEGQR